MDDKEAESASATRRPSDRQGRYVDPRFLADPVDLASRYLRKPVFNRIRYVMSRLLAAVPLFSDRQRTKFAWSAAKRDGRWLSQQLRDIAAREGADYRWKRMAKAQFDGFRGRERRDIAGSNWHTGYLRAIKDTETSSLPTVSISFVTFNSAKWLPGLFDSLLAQDYPLSKLNLFFVDSDSDDATVDLIDQFRQAHGTSFASVTLHRQQNLGFGMGHDVSFRNSKDDYVLIANVDLRFHAGSLVKVVKVAESDLETVASWELRQCPYEHPKYYDPVTLETSWTSYACNLVRRNAYMAVGGFEERIFMYGEDVELSYRFRGAGYKLRYVPQATVTHFVDFEDTELRPHQLSGSIAANVLLRFRYGSATTAKDGLDLLDKTIFFEHDQKRKKALETAFEQIERDRTHFETEKRPVSDVVFPFNGFDYDVTRLGHDTRLASEEPLDGPLVSVVTRTHGPNISLLKEAIASVCNQTYDRIEHVIVEDRTRFAEALVTDLQKTYGRNIRYVKSDGGGRSIAGNTGLQEATGALLMFLDNDDLLFADHIEILVRCLTANPDAPAAYALGWELPTFFDQNGGYREDAPVHIPRHATKVDASLLEEGNYFPIQCVLFRRALFEKHGGFDPDIDYLEDWNLWYRYFTEGQFQYVPKTTSMYRVPGDDGFTTMRSAALLAAEEAVKQKNAESLGK